MLGGGDLVPLTEVENIIEQADLNGDGEVSFFILSLLINC